MGLLVVILVLGTVLTLLAPEARGYNAFLNLNNVIPNIFTNMSWIAVMAVGMTVVVISGGIDISVGSIMGLAALGTAAVLQQLPPDTHWAIAIALGVGVPMAIGLSCGLINGSLVVFLRMHPFIVTLATLSIFRGIAQVSVIEGSLPYGDKVLHPAFTDHFIAWTVFYSRAVPGGGVTSIALQPIPMIIMLGIAFIGWVYLRRMVWGRETYAIGGNEEAARFSGIRVGWTKMRVYLISGLCAGIAGMLNCGYFKSAATNTGLGYELMVVAAAVVGGASLSGGRGTALGAMLGALIMQMIDNGIAILSNTSINFGLFKLTITQQYSMIITGIAIIVAVAIDHLSEYLQKRQMAGKK